jgi:hypothetical protein
VPSPFPGTDPYLEHPVSWPSVHTRLIAALDQELSSRLAARYYVSVEERFYVASTADLELAGIADVLVSRGQAAQWQPAGGNGRHGADGAGDASPGVQGSPNVLTVELPRVDQVRQRFLEIRTAGTHEVVTIVEILSPVNKRAGEGRQQYEAKRLAITNSLTSLVECDLLRMGEPLPALQQGRPLEREVLADYRILVCRSADGPRADLYAVSVRGPLPTIPVPLLPGEDELQVNLQPLLAHVYDLGRYRERIDYRAEPVPPLKPEDAAWADTLLREQGLR